MNGRLRIAVTLLFLFTTQQVILLNEITARVLPATVCRSVP